jgi:hypothetical protein
MSAPSIRLSRFFTLELRNIIGLRNLPRYLCDMLRWRGKITSLYPILTDYKADAGKSSGHYFHQDLLVAGFIYQANPPEHIDVGSRIDGFVAHVASFRPITIMDIRPMPPSPHPHIRFHQHDLMKPFSAADKTYPSISCLHAIEHFGLGRYGDPMNPSGHMIGFKNLTDMLSPGGVMYISFPIAAREKVEFNAHRAFTPGGLFQWLPNFNDIYTLERFDFVDDAGDLHTQKQITDVPKDLEFGCGIIRCVRKYNLHRPMTLLIFLA